MSSAKDKGLFVVLMRRSERRCDENMEKVEGLLSKVSAAHQPCDKGAGEGKGIGRMGRDMEEFNVL